MTHFHHHRGRGFRFEMGPRGFGFGPGGLHIDFGDGEGEWGGGGNRRRGRNRMFEGGELRLVLLKLLADRPRHGYELIKAIEELTDGDYAPSPGIVYPTLTMLDDMGLIAEQKSKESKKVFEATAEGRAHLEEHGDEVDELMERLEHAGARRRRHRKPEIGRAVGNMMQALKNRVAREGWNEELLNQVVDILDDAAKKIERID